MEQAKIDRINELARKKKAEGLTEEELAEQAELRKEYIEGYKRSLHHHIAGIKLVDEEDITESQFWRIPLKQLLVPFIWIAMISTCSNALC